MVGKPTGRPPAEDAASQACIRHAQTFRNVGRDLLGGSWDLVSRVLSTLTGVLCTSNCSYRPVTEPYDPFSGPGCFDEADGSFYKIPGGSYPTPFLGYLVSWIGSVR